MFVVRRREYRVARFAGSYSVVDSITARGCAMVMPVAPARPYVASRESCGKSKLRYFSFEELALNYRLIL